MLSNIKVKPQYHALKFLKNFKVEFVFFEYLKKKFLLIIFQKKKDIDHINQLKGSTIFLK